MRKKLLEKKMKRRKVSKVTWLLVASGMLCCMPICGQTVSDNGANVAEDDRGVEEIEEVIPEGDVVEIAEAPGLSKLEGEGTKDSPFLIRTAEDMTYIYDAYGWGMDGKYYYSLQNDIDLSLVNWEEPIGYVYGDGFDGFFWGNNHVIKLGKNVGEYGVFGKNSGVIQNLEINCSNGCIAIYPMCEINEGTIKDCKVTGESLCEVKGGYQNTGFVGENSGTIVNCTVSGRVMNVDNGLVCTNYGTIRNCSVTGKVNADYGVLAEKNEKGAVIEECTVEGNHHGGAGMVYSNAGTIKNCRVIGNDMNVSSGFADQNNGMICNSSVSGDMSTLDGFIGNNYGTGIVENCVVNITAEVQDGGIDGFAGGNSGTITGCAVKGVISNDTEKVNSICGFVGSNSGTISDSFCDAILKYKEMCRGDICGFAEYNEGKIARCRFTGKMENATNIEGFCVGNGSSENKVASIIDCYVKTDVAVYKGGDVTTAIYTGEGVVGFCEGNSGIISNCYMEGDIYSNLDKYSAAGFCDTNWGTIENSYCKGDISLNEANGNEGNDYSIGGFSGCNKAFLKNCFYEGNLCLKDGLRVGGLVGKNQGTISECYTKGHLESGSDLQNGDVGLLVGENWGGTIEKSMALGSVKTLNVIYVGGLVGSNSPGKISNCFTNVEITADRDINLIKKEYQQYAMNVRAGGIMGASFWFADLNTKESSITNCYSVSNITGKDCDREGILAYNCDTSVKNSFYLDVHTDDDGISQSIQALRNIDTYKKSGWDTTGIWAIDKNKNEGFPYIKTFANVFPVAQFYTAKVTVSGKGTVYPSGTFDVYAGENYDFRIVPQEGYYVSEVTVDGVNNGKNKNFTISAVKGNLDVKVVLSPTATVLKKGTKIKSKDATTSKGTMPKNATFTVTSSDAKNPTVSFDGVSSKTAKAVTIPKTITYKGITYKVTTVSLKSFTSSGDKAKYTVTGNKLDSLTVAYKAPSSKKSISAKIPEYTTYKGIKFKVTSVASKAFKGNTKIKTITIGAGVTKIGTSAFDGCIALKSISLGKGLKTIGKNAFKNCKKLTKITIKSTKLTKVESNALKGVNAKCEIKVPKSKLSKYKRLFKNKGQKKTVKVTK